MRSCAVLGARHVRDETTRHLGLHQRARTCLRRASSRAPSQQHSQTLQPHTTYHQIDQQDLRAFRHMIGQDNVLTEPHDLEPYNVDWMNKYRGNSKLALRPKTTQEVSKILAHCHERRLPVVPQGGNTGLVGGSVPIRDEIVLSLSRMNRVLSLDEHAGNLVCQSGCVLENLQNHVWARGYTMPLDLGAKGSCQIGGNIATNAGGLRFLRYGSLKGTVLGLEVVLADGTVLDNLSALRKDNTGYDLKQLFIGSEGTLGVITACALALPRASSSTQLALLGCESYEAVLQTFAAARRDLGEVLSAFEFVDRESFELVTSHGVRDPLGSGSRHYVLIELAGSDEAHDSEKLERFLEGVMEAGAVADGTIAQDETQTAAIWSIREGVTEALSKTGAVYKYDVSIPLAELYDLVDEMRRRLEPLGAQVTGFGHLGDGNLHLNIVTPGRFDKDESVLAQIEPYVFEWIRERRGSISAEHGVGVMKPPFLHMSKSAPMIALMGGVKRLLDPRGILNPGKVLPPLERALDEA